MFEYFRGNPLLPILSLTPEGRFILLYSCIFECLNFSGKHLSKYSIRLHTSVLDPDYFKQSKLAPGRNSVRRRFLSPTSIQPNPSDESDVGAATPHYNAAMLVELGARERHLKELFLSAQECPGLVDAVILFKVWARQRGLSEVRAELTRVVGSL